MTEGTEVVVVGAGIAGASCANEISRAGISVTVLDRGRSPGGRMSPQLLQGRRVDVGASYFTVSDRAFDEVVQRWRRLGLVRPWTDTFDVNAPGQGPSQRSGPTRWSSTQGGSSALVNELLAQESVETGRTVERVGHDGTRPTVDSRPAEIVVLAMPDPQAGRIMAPSVDSDDAAMGPAREASAQVGYDPVIAVTATWAERLWPFSDAVFVNDHPRISFVADDGARKGDGDATLVVHTVSSYAAKHLDDPSEVIEPVLADLAELFGISTQPLFAREHRWTFAKPAGTHGSAAFLLTDSGIGLAGDSWCSGGSPRVESAWLSGAELGRAIVRRLS
jgi:renalase